MATDPSQTPPKLSGLEEACERYDAFILDLWGCVHNGVQVFPGVLDGLTRLRKAGKQVLMLSNAPRRASVVVDQLARMYSIGPDLYDAVLTSGEVTWQALKARDDAAHAALGYRCFHIGPQRDLSMFEGNGLEKVGTVAAADFMLTTGPDDDRADVAAHEPALRAGRARGLTLVCANPDLEVIRGETRLICAGALAARYQSLGGDVIYHGKPHEVTYRVALNLLGHPKRVLGIGDALRTDVLGAVNAGIDSAFIPGGIHGGELGIAMGELPPNDAIGALVTRLGVRPTYLLPALRW